MSGFGPPGASGHGGPNSHPHPHHHSHPPPGAAAAALDEMMNGIPLIPPPPPIPATSVTNDHALNAMLMSWYMVGYHSGYYLGIQHGVTAAAAAAHHQSQPPQQTNAAPNNNNSHSQSNVQSTKGPYQNQHRQLNNSHPPSQSMNTTVPSCAMSVHEVENNVLFMQKPPPSDRKSVGGSVGAGGGMPLSAANHGHASSPLSTPNQILAQASVGAHSAQLPTTTTNCSSSSHAAAAVVESMNSPEPLSVGGGRVANSGDSCPTATASAGGASSAQPTSRPRFHTNSMSINNTTTNMSPSFD